MILGHRVNNDGIHADSGKLEAIQKWPQPADYHGIQRFLGLVNYVGQFMPDVLAYTSPLHTMCRQKVFQWLPIHQKCFESIKALTAKPPILKPVDYDRAVKEGEKIFISKPVFSA